MRACRLLVAAMLIVVAAPAPASASAGALDPSFNGTGFNVTSVVGQAFAVAIQSDGKIVVGGSGGGLSDGSLALARYDADGSLDTTFGNGGLATAPGNVAGSYVTGLAIQPDGKIVAVLSSPTPGSPYTMAVARFDESGAPDVSFGIGGAVIEPNIAANAVTLQPDGKILIGGATPNPIFRDTSPDFALARLDAAGTLDPTFGAGGTVRTDFDTGRDILESLLVQPDGKIVAGGEAAIGFSFSDFALARYNPDGSLDQTFGTYNGVTVAGEVTTNFPAGDAQVHDLALQPDGKIVAAGEIGVLSSTIIPSSDIALARYQADGTLDQSFGSGGTVDIDFGPGSPGIGTNEEVQAVALQPDGKLVTAGARSDTGDSPSSFMVDRFKPNGSLDPSFGSAGVVTASLRSNDSAFDLALQADGKIVAAGYSFAAAPPTLDFGVARFLTDSPEARITALTASVDSSGLPEGLIRSLDAKLRPQCGSLLAFENEVRAQTDRTIPRATASGWLAESASIRVALGCEP